MVFCPSELKQLIFPSISIDHWILLFRLKQLIIYFRSIITIIIAIIGTILFFKEYLEIVLHKDDRSQLERSFSCCVDHQGRESNTIHLQVLFGTEVLG
jgi:hypothetical protein